MKVALEGALYFLFLGVIAGAVMLPFDYWQHQRDSSHIEASAPTGTIIAVAGTITGTKPAIGRLQIGTDGKCQVIALNDATEFGVIDSETTIVYRKHPGVLGDGALIDLDTLHKDFNKRAVTINARVEYTTHAEEVFRPVHVIEMEIFLNDDGQPRVQQ